MKEESGLQTFWEWEKKILEQEREYIESKLEEAQDTGDSVEDLIKDLTIE